MNEKSAPMNANLPQTPLPYKVMAIYKFADLPDAEAIQPVLAKFCCSATKTDACAIGLALALDVGMARP